MKQRLYSVYDKVAQTHQGINFERNDASAVRNFKRSMNEQNKQLQQQGHLTLDLGEFELHYLGEMDDVTGVIEPTPKGYINLALNIDNDIGA